MEKCINENEIKNYAGIKDIHIIDWPKWMNVKDIDAVNSWLVRRHYAYHTEPKFKLNVKINWVK